MIIEDKEFKNKVEIKLLKMKAKVFDNLPKYEDGWFEACSDCLYAISLSKTALVSHINIWHNTASVADCGYVDAITEVHEFINNI